MKKFNESVDSVMNEFVSICEKIIIPEIDNIKFVLEDEGAEIFLTMGGKPGLPPGLYISIKPGFGKLSNKLKRRNYSIIYQEFVDRVEEICEQNNCCINVLEYLDYSRVTKSGYVEEKYGYIFKILPVGIKLPKGYISYRQLRY